MEAVWDGEFLRGLRRLVVSHCRMLIRIRRSARLLYIDARRSENHRSVELFSNDIDVEQEMMEREVVAALQREIRELPPTLRHVLILRDVQEWSMTAVAERLHIGARAAKSRVLRARLELRERMIARCSVKAHGTSASIRLRPEREAMNRSSRR